MKAVLPSETSVLTYHSMLQDISDDCYPCSYHRIIALFLTLLNDAVSIIVMMYRQ